MDSSIKIILMVVVICGIFFIGDYLEDRAYQNLEVVDYNISVIGKSWEKGLPQDVGIIETNYGTMTTQEMSIYSKLVIGESYNVSTKTESYVPDIIQIGR